MARHESGYELPLIKGGNYCEYRKLKEIANYF